MKTFLALLISCLTLSAATTYPVLTDSTNRLFPGGVTNVFFLNSNVVTTGTMRATGALTLTNASNVFAGDGSRLTGISAGISTSGGSATNLSVYSSGTTNRPFRVYGTNGTSEVYIDKDGGIKTPNGSASVLAIDFGAAGVGFYNESGNLRAGAAMKYPAGTYIQEANSSEALGSYGSTSGVGLRSAGNITWGSSTVWYLSQDSAISRRAAGVLEINTSTAGQLRDLLARSLYATNLYATNLTINGGATVTKILSATATLNFDLTALTVEDLTITVTGAADGDVVTLGVPNGSVTTSVQYSAWVSAADTVTVRARTSAIGENPASGTFRATVIKH